MNTNQNNHNNDAAISDANLDKVAGGFFATSFFIRGMRANAGASSGGMNDAHQQFQQILEQLTF